MIYFIYTIIIIININIEKKKSAKKNEKQNEKLTEDGDDNKENDICLWRSSIPVQKPNLADDGFDSEVGIYTT